jgi:hypothetical protein
MCPAAPEGKGRTHHNSSVQFDLEKQDTHTQKFTGQDLNTLGLKAHLGQRIVISFKIFLESNCSSGRQNSRRDPYDTEYVR